jgi:carbon-monoxide dehydrogenase medium subunit
VRLPKFEYFEPKDLKEAVAILQNEPSAKILAGGTDLLINMKHRVECPATIVNIKGIDDLEQSGGSGRLLSSSSNGYTSRKYLSAKPMQVL